MPDLTVHETTTGIEVDALSHRWRWSPGTDGVTILDPSGREIVAHPLQPAVEVTSLAGAPGRCDGYQPDGDRLTVTYAGVNGAAGLRLTMRFTPRYAVLEDVRYLPAGDEAIVRVAYFGGWSGGAIVPAATADVCVIPGGRQQPEQAIFPTAAIDDQRYSVGYFGLGTESDHQQWALPHYLVACYAADAAHQPASAAACIGLGALPDGHALVRIDRGRFCYEVDIRADLWGHRRGPAEQRFEWPVVFGFGDDWYQAGLAHFDALYAEGLARPKPVADVPASAFLPQYDTWGDQGSRRAFLERFSEEHLRAIRDDVTAAGLHHRLFVIDDKWESAYGSLEHDTVRFPRFPELLDEIRAEGAGIGIWTAFPRCEDFRALGLTEHAVLRTPSGEPYVDRQRKRQWYIFDPTHPPAAALLAERARHLVRAYRPAMVKIDFGYEIPLPSDAAPHDPSRQGERLLLRFLEIIAGAIKAEDPSVAILYYSLTPLLAPYIDQCGSDDMWMSRGAYDACFAKRALLMSWCGAMGVVPYGSSGYDWRSIDEIWLDTAVIGTPGVIAPLAGDEYGATIAPRQAARYNGIARITRASSRFRVQFYDAELFDHETGPRAYSWARIEDAGPAVAVLRPRAGRLAVAPGIARATCAAAVATLTDAPLDCTARLAIVPFGEGAFVLRRSHVSRVEAVGRLAGGGTAALAASVSTDDITLALVTEAAGVPVEWIEVTIE
jgi:hypothetical protein